MQRPTPLIALLLAASLMAPTSHAVTLLEGLFGKTEYTPPKSGDKLYEANEFDFVRLTATDTIGNQHPVQVSVDQLKSALAGIELKNGDNKSLPLFTDDELTVLSAPISYGFSRATTGQDITFMSTERHGALGLLAPKLGTSGRMFIKDNRLHVIIGDAHVEYQAQYRMTGFKRTFSQGDRQAASKVTLQLNRTAQTAGGQQIRNDWVALSLQTPTTIASPITTPVAPLSSVPVNSGKPVATTPIGVNMTPSSTPVALPREQRSVEDRLRALQALRDKNLVTDDEYRQKRVEILKDL
ncbi:SHOCT domain-containing protein [Chitinivorax sp. B]|uniref:SHOCT domain-containing protein n=1 Tax=Chitinivorax sp. B TaxID=2502235 RepID=UPI0010F6F9B5|nr:SHOCT domain-containing protein [Chitinivorax sp. B]